MYLPVSCSMPTGQLNQLMSFQAPQPVLVLLQADL
jgi:hypothetical protein